MVKRYSAYNSTNTCEICKNKLIPGNARREYKKEGNWTGRWLCKSCYDKNRPGNLNKVRKYLADSRTGNLDPNCGPGKGRIFEQLTVKVRGVKNLNIENDNFRSLIDHSRDPEYGIIQTVGRVCKYGWWSFHVEREHNKEFDNLFFYCIDEYMKNVERVYIFPRKEILNRNSISIMKDSHTRHWYDQYRVDEKPYNDAYHNLDNNDFKELGLRKP